MRAIGRCALKVESTVDKCVSVLVTLLQSRISYVVQEAVIVIRDIFRKYPGKYTTVIVSLCQVMELLDDPDAKASMVWIIGEYCDVIDNAGELMDVFLDSFHDEAPAVQLEDLTAVVKLFLKHPSEGQSLVTSVLNHGHRGVHQRRRARPRIPLLASALGGREAREAGGAAGEAHHPAGAGGSRDSEGR